MPKSKSVWRIATDTQQYISTDLTGEGARTSGGRWNSEGIPLIYCAESVALACLETLVHLNQDGLPLNRYLVRLDFPIRLWTQAKVLTKDNAEVGWDAVPYGMVSTQVGNRWCKQLSSALFLVPSIVIPEETNILVNPLHPDANEIKAYKLRKFTFDQRLRSRKD
jgi:RES domain-containing protein